MGIGFRMTEMAISHNAGQVRVRGLPIKFDNIRKTLRYTGFLIMISFTAKQMILLSIKTHKPEKPRCVTGP